MLAFYHFFFAVASVVSLTLMLTPKGRAFVQRRLMTLVCSGVGLLFLAAVMILLHDLLRAAQWSDPAVYGAIISCIMWAGFFLLCVPMNLVMLPRLTGWHT
jgi:hypothetical protein